MANDSKAGTILRSLSLASTGIGRSTAVAFAKKGARVVVAGRRDEAGKALVEELCSLGSESEFINADVRKEDAGHAWGAL